MDALKEAIENILACPVCKGTLSIDEKASCVRCACCQRAYALQDGVPVFLQEPSEAQEDERQFRDALAAEYGRSGGETLLEVVAQHHCAPIMQRQAERFHARFAPHEWILDIGIGYGWHWADSRKGAGILGIDISLGNLILGRRLLGRDSNRAVLVCADAAVLPIREQSISGVWSVQAFQHFPQPLLNPVLAELNRVLKSEFAIEIYNLNPALFLRAIYRLFGKQLHRHGKTVHMELNRLSADEWNAVWQQFKSGKTDISSGYSELFFHPDLHLRPRRYPVKLERTLAAHAPGLAALFARQVLTQIRSKPLQASA